LEKERLRKELEEELKKERRKNQEVLKNEELLSNVVYEEIRQRSSFPQYH